MKKLGQSLPSIMEEGQVQLPTKWSALSEVLENLRAGALLGSFSASGKKLGIQGTEIQSVWGK